MAVGRYNARLSRRTRNVAMRGSQHLQPSRRDMQRLAEFVQGCLFLDEHRQKLVDKHAEAWVAIHRNRVVGTGATLDGLLRALKARKVDATACFIKFLTKKKVVHILGGCRVPCR